jgi:hypothetical protein
MIELEQNWWQIVIPVDQHDRLLELLKRLRLQLRGRPRSGNRRQSCRAYYFARRVEAEQIAEEFGVEASPAPKG